MKHSWILVLGILLASCGTPGGTGQEKVAKLEAGHKIAVLSLMAEEANVKEVQTLTFLTADRYEVVEDFGVNAYIENLTSGKLVATEKYEIVRSQSSLFRERFGQLSGDSWLSDSENEERLQEIRKFAKDSGAQSILVIAPTTFDGNSLFRAGPFTSFEGHGIYQWYYMKWFGSAKHASYYITLRLELIDADSGGQIARTTEAGRSQALEDGWMVVEGHFSMENQRNAKSGFESLFDTVLTNALSELQML